MEVEHQNLETQSEEAVPMAPWGKRIDVSRRPWPFIVVAALGSALIWLVEFAIPMWLPAHHAEPFLDVPKLLGTTPEARDRFLLAAGALVALYLVALRASASLRGARSALAVLGLSILMQLPLLLTYPGGAGDLFAYMAEADLVLKYRANPYTTPVASFPGHPVLPYVDFPHETTHYGPLWLGTAVLLRSLAGGGLLAGVLAFKVGAGLFLLCTAWLVFLTVRRTRPGWAVPAALLVAWNPLLLFDTAGNGHNDVAMMLPVMLAFYLFGRGLNGLAIAALVAASSVKYVSAILLPLFLVTMIRRAGNRRGWLIAAAAYGVAAAGGAAALVATLGFEGTVGVLLEQSRWFTTSPAAVAHLWLSERAPAEEMARIVSRTGQAIFVGYFLFAIRGLWIRPKDLVQSSLRALLVFLLVVVSWFQPWYTTWVIPVAALAAAPIPHAIAVGLTVGAFLTYTVMGFVWRIEWAHGNLTDGNLIMIHLAGAAAAWLPVALLAAATWMATSLFRR